MSHKPQLSVIVPIYKVEPYLQKCIDSILNQTFRDLELILVDDGSPDNCPAICDAAAEKDERVVVLHQKNAGLSAARNAGLTAARGDYIGFVDSDDYIASEMYQTLYDAMTREDAQIAVCSYTYVNLWGVMRGRRSPITKYEVLDRVQILNRLDGDRGWYYITACNRLYRKEIFESIRFPVGKLHEDQYTAHLLYWECKRVVVVPQAFYYYLQRDGSIMRQESIAQKLDEINGFLNRAEFMLVHQLYSAASKACNGALGNLVGISAGPGTGMSIEERNALSQTLERARTVIRKYSKTSGRGKWKLWLFYISPKLYRVMLIGKQKIKAVVS